MERNEYADYIRIHFPYGMAQNEDGNWFVFNRYFLEIGQKPKLGGDNIYLENIPKEKFIYTFTQDFIDNMIKKHGLTSDYYIKKFFTVYFYFAGSVYVDKKHVKIQKHNVSKYLDVIQDFGLYDLIKDKVDFFW